MYEFLLMFRNFIFRNPFFFLFLEYVFRFHISLIYNIWIRYPIFFFFVLFSTNSVVLKFCIYHQFSTLKRYPLERKVICSRGSFPYVCFLFLFSFFFFISALLFGFIQKPKGVFGCWLSSITNPFYIRQTSLWLALYHANLHLMR